MCQLTAPASWHAAVHPPAAHPPAFPLRRAPQIVPEFSFLDARGVGELERLPLSEVAAALEAGDSLSPTWCGQLLVN